jgi:hypothetical protein
MGLRIRWQAAGKLVAGVVGVFFVLQVFPELFEPPEPPPIPADVGLPRVVRAPPVQLAAVGPARSLGRVARRRQDPPADPPAPPPSAPPVERPAPEPEPAPEPAAEPAIESPPPPPPPPEDGSAEFAPH